MTMAPTNQVAWLHKAGEPLKVGDATLPTPGPGEIVVHPAAVAINPLDWHMAKMGVFVQQWPAVFGCDVAGTVHEVGADVSAQGRFKVGDRVIGLVSLTPSFPLLCVASGTAIDIGTPGLDRQLASSPA